MATNEKEAIDIIRSRIEELTEERDVVKDEIRELEREIPIIEAKIKENEDLLQKAQKGGEYGHK